MHRVALRIDGLSESSETEVVADELAAAASIAPFHLALTYVERAHDICHAVPIEHIPGADAGWSSSAQVDDETSLPTLDCACDPSATVAEEQLVGSDRQF